jgi:hypothetical protein
MRKLLSIIPLVFSLGAWAAGPSSGPLVGPGVTGEKLPSGETIGADVGAGPHKQKDLKAAPRVDDEVPAADRPDTRGNSSTGASGNPDSATRGSSGADSDAIEKDEERANKNKDKFKQRPGYKEDVPLPRASKY